MIALCILLGYLGGVTTCLLASLWLDRPQRSRLELPGDRVVRRDR